MKGSFKRDTKRLSSGSLARIKREKLRRREREFLSLSDEKNWLQLTVAKLENFVEELGELAEHMEEITVRPNRNFIKPTRLQRLTDAGNSRTGRMEVLKAQKAVRKMMNECAKHPLFRKEASLIYIDEPAEPVAMNQFLSRARTRFQLRQQSISVRQAMSEIRTLARNMTLRVRDIERTEKEVELNKKFSSISESVQSIISQAKKKEKAK